MPSFSIDGLHKRLGRDDTSVTHAFAEVFPRRLFKSFRGNPTIDDIIELLNWLPEGDARWSDLMWLAPQREEGR